MVENVPLFVPIGFLLGGIVSKGFVKACPIGCVLSILIELLQFATGRGLCETNDVIHNTVGCLVGYGLTQLFAMRFDREHNNVILSLKK